MKLNKIRLYEISDELSHIVDYVPYLLRNKWFDHSLWMRNIEKCCTYEEQDIIRHKIYEATLLTKQERMEELAEWLERYPKYRDVLIW